MAPAELSAAHAAQALRVDQDAAQFVPSRHLPRARLLDASTVADALVRLRRAFGLPAPGTPAVRRVTPGTPVPADQWPAWLAPLLPEHTVCAARDAISVQASESGTQRQIGLDDAFEHRTALTWLQHIVSAKVQITDDAQQSLSADALVDWAAELLACAAGKAASGPEMTVFQFPQAGTPDVQVSIRDGTLVDDALGARTWGAAPLLAAELLSRPACPLRVLELGAGTGLVGLALAARSASQKKRGSGASVVLTDHHPTVLANLEHNTTLFLSEHEGSGVEVQTLPLDWYRVYAASSGIGMSAGATSWTTTAQTLPGTPGLPTGSDSLPTPPTPASAPAPGVSPMALSLPPGAFDTLIAADCVYDPAHPVWIKAVAHRFLSRAANARLHVTSPLRNTHRAEIEALLAAFPRSRHQGAAAAAAGLCVLDAAVIYGQDDFGGASRAQRMNDQAGARRVYLRLEVGWAAA